MHDDIVKRAYRKLLTPSRRQSIHSTLNRFRAQMGAFWIKPLVSTGEWRQYFDLWEKHGFHVTPDHFYSPIPGSSDLPDSVWNKETGFTGIDPNESTQLDFLQRVFPAYHDEYAAFPHHKTSIPYQYHYDNTLL
ncbi:MAG TPA: hypothetical protein VHP83_05905 [Aggregatilineaceae bacterium]|nr:hypothetical protein [Aggregatilineaceae bacterium]